MTDNDRQMPTYPDTELDHVDPESALLRFAAGQLQLAADAHEAGDTTERDVRVDEALAGLEAAAEDYEHLDRRLSSGETVGCYRWSSEDVGDSFWSSYPSVADRDERSEVSILFWDAGAQR